MKKALQARGADTDHISSDLGGRRVDLDEPLMLAELAPTLEVREPPGDPRTARSRQSPAHAWQTGRATSFRHVQPSPAYLLSNVANVAAIEVGSRIIGSGVGREVYVNAKNVAQGTLTLSQPLYGARGNAAVQF